MGFTGLVRWPNAPTTGLDLVKQNIFRNHAGIERGKWFLSVKSFRTASGSAHGFQMDRSMCALTISNHAFVFLEDPAAPQVADMAALAHNEQNPSGTPADTPGKYVLHSHQSEPPHFRTTLITASPPGALEQLITQLGARWTSTRQPSANARNQAMATGNQLVIDGSIFSIGTDWLVRVGNVILAGGAVKGMLLEAEYLPLPKIHSPAQNGTSDLLSNLLISILPNISNATPVAVTVDDSQWEEVQWNCNETEYQDDGLKKADTTDEDREDDDIYAYEDEEDPSVKQKGDWTGVDRDRRSAFLIIGALKSEGIL
ncbi:hypothetical protein EW145_g1467 [Phellinidium pouzarii]|uniref:Uncharacterized protein n=1 Tax=Phellinidium pouzarii TaxID=167371 RepID=A0A4S4LEP8_9AGAM|nr:hypothetical protein EW145_g1467 [Phellinidium pouzarii]